MDVALPARHVSFSVAIERVRANSVESLEVDMIDAVSDFFVARETQSNRAVGDLGVGHQMGGGRHDHGDSGFVVGPQKRCAVGRMDKKDCSIVATDLP